MQKGCSCIIPFYNESQRVLDTVEKVLQIKLVSRIICVDDGSTDGAAILLAEKYPQITVIRLSQNQGKSAAIHAGLKQVATSHVMMLDADLIGIIPEEYDKGIKYLFDHPKADMIIFRQTKAFFITWLTGTSISYSGQRVMKTPILEGVFTREVNGYQIEVALNQYCIDNNKTVYWTDFSAENTFKIKKVGLVDGISREFQMVYETLYIGFPKYLQQVTFFVDKRIPEEKLSYKIKQFTIDLLKE